MDCPWETWRDWPFYQAGLWHLYTVIVDDNWQQYNERVEAIYSEATKHGLTKLNCEKIQEIDAAYESYMQATAPLLADLLPKLYEIIQDQLNFSVFDVE